MKIIAISTNGSTSLIVRYRWNIAFELICESGGQERYRSEINHACLITYMTSIENYGHR